MMAEKARQLTVVGGTRDDELKLKGSDSSKRIKDEDLGPRLFGL